VFHRAARGSLGLARIDAGEPERRLATSS
jgi:hypothetical protein